MLQWISRFQFQKSTSVFFYYENLLCYLFSKLFSTFGLRLFTLCLSFPIFMKTVTKSSLDLQHIWELVLFFKNGSKKKLVNILLTPVDIQYKSC